MSCFFKFVNETISLKVRSTSSPNKKRKSGRLLYLHREWTILKLMRGLKWSLLGENGKRRERRKRQGPRSKFSSGGAKEECVKENFFVKLFFV